MALVGAAAVASWRVKAGAPARAVGAAAAAAMISAHLFLVFYVHGVFGSAAVLLALEDRGTFLAKRLDYYPCAAFASASLGAHDKIMVVGEQRGYYLTPEHLSSTVQAPNLYVRLGGEAASPEDLAGSLRAQGFTHLLFVPREAARLAGSLGIMTERGAANWNALESRLAPAYRGPACLLAALGSS